MNPDVAVSTEDQNILIRASAGTGKTYQLAERYISLIQGTSPERILATTFTRKAAGEILERILLRLAADDASPERQQLLCTFTRGLHRVRISTLDSFFVNVGSSISLELGLPTGWRIIDEHELAQLRLRAIEGLLNDESTADVVRLMHMLSHGESRRRVAAELLDAVEKFHDLYLTTDHAAWQKLQPRPCLTNDELNQTLEEFSRVPRPRNSKWDKAHEKSAVDAARNDWDAFFRRGIGKALIDGKDTFERLPIPRDVADVYRKLIRHAQALIITQLADRNEATWKLLDRYHESWSEIAREARVQTFSDVTRHLAAHFTGGPDATGDDDPRSMERVAFRIDSQIDHLLLDEFQDTSISQWQALSKLAQHCASGDSSSFFCVGDEKQAIYSWRQGRSELFTHLDNRVERLSARDLNTSWRSAQPVIDTVNLVFQNLNRHSELKENQLSAVTEFTRGFPEHTTVKGNLVGYTALLAAESNDGELPRAAIARKIIEIVRNIQSQAPGCSIGILMRKNEHVGKIVYALRGAGIDASEEGGTPITDSAAVQIALSALTLADHPGDTVARFHVAQSPLGAYLGLCDHRDASQACNTAASIRSQLVDNGYSTTLARWVEALVPMCNSRETHRLSQLVELADTYQPLATLRPADFVRFIKHRKIESPSDSPVRAMTIHQAKGLQFDAVILGELETRLSPKISPSFVTSETDPFAQADGMCSYANQQIQNLLPPDVQQMFPATAQRGVREALCMLYVAMTRAIRALYMVCPPVLAENKISSTYEGLLRAAMIDGRSLEPREVIGHGDPCWFDSVPDEMKHRRPPLEHETKREPIVFAAPDSDESRPLRAVAPSRITSPGAVRLSRVLQTSSRRAQDRGTLIHAWFESLRWLDDGRPSPAELKQIANEIAASELDIPSCLSQFQSMLAAREIAYTLSRASYQPPRSLSLSPSVLAELAEGPLDLEVERERRFVIRDQGAIVSGSIDRLILMSRDNRLLAADILDYKTDAAGIRDDESLARREHYQAQLRSYARAVARIYQIDENRISTRLVWLSSGRVEAVDWRRRPEVSDESDEATTQVYE